MSLQEIMYDHDSERVLGFKKELKELLQKYRAEIDAYSEDDLDESVKVRISSTALVRRIGEEDIDVLEKGFVITEKSID